MTEQVNNALPKFLDLESDGILDAEGVCRYVEADKMTKNPIPFPVWDFVLN